MRKAQLQSLAEAPEPRPGLGAHPARSSPRVGAGGSGQELQ